MLSEETWNFLLKISASLGTGGVALLLVAVYVINKERVLYQRQLFEFATKGIEVMSGTKTALYAAEKTITELRRETALLRERIGSAAAAARRRRRR